MLEKLRKTFGKEKLTFSWKEITFEDLRWSDYIKLYYTCNENGKIVGKIEPTTLYFACYYLNKDIGHFWKLEDAKKFLEEKCQYRYGVFDE